MAATNAIPVSIGNIFKGLKGTKPTVNALYFARGTYWVRIDNCGAINTRKHGDGLVVETTVIKVVQDIPGVSHRVGECPSRLFMPTGPQADFFKPDLAAFVGAMFGMKGEDVGEEEAMMAFGPQNIMRNMVAEVDVRQTMTKLDKPFTKSTFRGPVKYRVVYEALSAEDRARFFPGDLLERLIQAQEAQPA